MTVLEDRRELAWSSSIRAWMVGSGVIPMSHGLWKSAVV